MSKNIIQYVDEIERILARHSQSQSDEFSQGLRYCDCIRQEVQPEGDVELPSGKKCLLTYDDFYDIAEYANENWKGSFTKKEIAVYAYRYLSDFLFSIEHGRLVPTIETLCKGLKEDLDSGYDADVDHWLTQIERTGLWCRNYEKK